MVKRVSKSLQCHLLKTKVVYISFFFSKLNELMRWCTLIFKRRKIQTTKKAKYGKLRDIGGYVC